MTYPTMEPKHLIDYTCILSYIGINKAASAIPEKPTYMYITHDSVDVPKVNLLS